MATNEKTALKVLNMTAEQRDDVIKALTSKEFIATATSIVAFVKGALKVWSSEDKAMFEHCNKMLQEGNFESFEEKKYWMDTMKEISQKIDKKTFWAWVIGIGSVAGAAVGTVLYALSHKK